MIRQLLLITILLCWLPPLGGYAAAEPPGQAGKTADATLQSDLRARAKALEKQGALREALFTLRAAAALEPGAKYLAQQIQRLEQACENAAQVRFRKGIEYYQGGQPDKARLALMSALLYAPDHQGALSALKKTLNSVGQQTYKVQRGDSFTKIAAALFQDPTKAYLLAYFNDLDPNKPLPLDTLLVIPDLNTKRVAGSREIEVLLESARSALDQRQYAQTLEITAAIETQNPGNESARRIKDDAHYGWAVLLVEREDYASALEQIKLVSSTYKGRAKVLQNARLGMRRVGFESKLLKAGALLKKGAYSEAVKLCETLVMQDPSAPQAKSLLDAAHYALGKQQLDQGRETAAIAALNLVDPGYQDTAQLLTQAHARLNAQAESLYRNGVKYFINEELELAIESWQKALLLNPNHPKAQQDIDNARHLLEKWRKLDKEPKNGTPADHAAY